MRKLVILLFLLVLFSGEQVWAFTWTGGAPGTTSVLVNPPLINCGGFGQGSTHQTGNCGVSFPTDSDIGAIWLGGSPNGAVPAMSGTAINMIPNGAVHNGISVIYQAGTLPISKFSATVVWVANNWNFSFILENSTNQSGFTGPGFAGGAGCEGGFFQGFGPPTPPDNVFALQFDQTQQIVQTDSGFTYSGEGIFQSNVAGWPNVYVQCPCISNTQCGTNNTPGAITSASKISTFPVPLNSPATTVATTTGDTYQAALTYDGTTLTVVFSDLTVGGSLTKAWTVNIVNSVGSTKAWVGLVGSTNAASTAPLLVNSFVYSVPSPL